MFDQGDTSGYKSGSEADAALVGLLLFYAAADLEQVDRLFRRSALYRDKWNRADYRRSTIRFAANGRTEFYSHFVAPQAEVIAEQDEEPVAKSPTSTLTSANQRTRG